MLAVDRRCLLSTGERRRLGLLVHHTDAERDTPRIGNPTSDGWTLPGMWQRTTIGSLVDAKTDWNQISPAAGAAQQVGGRAIT